MYERFSGKARSAIFFAEREAVRTGTWVGGVEHLVTGVVGMEHILAGLLVDNECNAAKIMSQFGLSRETIEPDFRPVALDPSQLTAPAMPQWPSAKLSIDLALKESRRLKDSYVGTEHLLLGLLLVPDELITPTFSRMDSLSTVSAPPSQT